MMKKMLNNKAGVLDNLSTLAIGIAALAITITVVFLIMGQLGANAIVSADQNASAAVKGLQSATDTIPTWTPIIIIAFIGSILLGLVALFRRR